MIHKIVWFLVTFIVLWFSLEISIFLYLEGYGWINPEQIPGMFYRYFETGEWPCGGMADAPDSKSGVQ